ncbi:MAG: DinB family protein [Bacteroidia bacterium]|nr:DinB family protein [Bacteroidia bacterium]
MSYTPSKSGIVPMPAYFDRYILKVPGDALIPALEDSLSQWIHSDWSLLARIGDKVYQPGKWTVRDILQHIIDTERIMSYRALRFARADKTLLPGFDEDFFAAGAGANLRSLSALKEELVHLRMANIAMFRDFSREQMERSGICFHTEITVLALGFVLAGHQLHHFQVMQERYYPLAASAE